MNFAAATTLQLCAVVIGKDSTEEEKRMAGEELFSRIGKEKNGQEQHG